MATQDFKEAVKMFSPTPFISNKTISNYRTFIRAIQTELDSMPNAPQILEDWILPQINNNNKYPVSDLLEYVLYAFDNVFSVGPIGIYKNSDCRAALASFAKYIIGQYKANLFLASGRVNELEFCKSVAQFALFCKVDVASLINSGKLGSKLNKPNGNKYYSWFSCLYQRKAINQQRRIQYQNPSGAPNPQGTGYYITDDNSMANQAIKKAIIAGLPKWMQTKYTDFEDYMACHIWDGTCYSYLYHTSVFNLVLLPTSIAGLSDYCPVVKEILHYEAAMRFGVYPIMFSCNYTLSPKAQKIYNKLHNLWRQQDEHQIAVNNAKNKMIPTPI